MTGERPTDTLRGLIDAFKVSQAIGVAATLGIADLLAGGARSAVDLAAATETHPGALGRLLSALACAGVLRTVDGDHFELTEVGEGLRSDSDEPLGAWARFATTHPTWNTWGALLHSVRTGESAFAHVHGEPAWEYRSSHPDAAERFDSAMSDNTRRSNADLIDAYDFGRFGTIVDVGGGRGAFLAALLGRHPGMRGVLFDLPHVVQAPPDLADRLTVVTGSFFDSVPPGGDAYVMKYILHDWDDEDALAILRACRQAMAPDTSVLVIERDLGRPGERLESKVSDLNMLVSLGGRERTIDEYAALMERAGLHFVDATPIRSALHVIEGRAA
jgi:hypothetical protein